MKLTFLRPLYVEQGPFASIYLDTSRDTEDPDHAVELRWRHLKQDLEAHGADTTTAGVLARVVGTDRDVPGTHGQAVFAAQGRLVLAEELPEPPAGDSARFSILPDGMAVAVQHAPDIPYVAVDVRRVAELEREVSQQDLEVEAQAGHWPTSKVAGEDRTLWRVPSRAWLEEAAGVAAELTTLADHGSAEVIVLAGDVWARGVLSHKMPKRLHDRIIAAESHAPPAVPGRALLEKELDHLLRGRLTIGDRTRVETFLSRRARHSGATEGLTAVVDALRRGQAEALLVNEPVDLSMRLWVGTAPKQIALSEAELHAFGVRPCWEEPADAALIRAVAGTRAELIVVPRQELPMVDGLGALLRYPDAGT